MTKGDKLRQADDIELAANISFCIASFLIRNGLLPKKAMSEFMHDNVGGIIEWLQEESEE